MTDPTSLESSQPCVPTKYAEGFKKAILNLLSHEGLWECGGGLKNTHTRAILVVGGKQKAVFHTFLFRVCLV